MKVLSLFCLHCHPTFLASNSAEDHLVKEQIPEKSLKGSKYQTYFFNADWFGMIFEDFFLAFSFSEIKEESSFF